METPKPASASAPDQKLHFLDYWRIIRIRKTVILAVFLLVVLTTTAVTFILPQTFRSTVRIEVGKDTTDIAPILMGVQGQAAYDPYFIQTEFEKIKSTKVLYEVIKDLELGKKWMKRYGAENELKREDVVRLLLRNIDVRQSRNTSLIEIQAYDEDPKLASEIANKIAAVYKKQRQERSLAAAKISIEILKGQQEEQYKRMTNAQLAMDTLRRDLKVGDIDLGGLVQTSEPEAIRTFERQKAEYEIRLANQESLMNQLTNMPRALLPQSIPGSSVPDTRLIELLSQKDLAEATRTGLLEELGKNNPKVVANASTIEKLQEQIDARVNGILRQIQVEIDRYTKEIQFLTKRIDVARLNDATMQEKYRPYFTAKRNYDTQQTIYQTISLRVVQEGIDSQLPKTSSVEVVEEAEPSQRPVRPQIALNIALGVVVGLVMGFGLAFFIEYLDTSVKTIDDVERALQAPVLGVIPQNVGPLIQEGPDSPHAEAYRVLRTNILFSRKDPMANTMTVVSGGAGEGKSTTIFNLATVFAQNGSRVLIVDSDLRRPSLHKILNVSNALGLTNYLLKQNTMEEVIQTTPLPTLFFLPSGKLPSSSLGILNSTQMKEFISQVKERFDFVFFDSPPIMGVSDASVLASEVDMAVLVIQYRKYPQAMTIRAKQMVEKVGGTMLGVVLNNINISQDSYYYYYSGYYYDYYSKHDDDDDSTKKNGESKKTASSRGGVDLKKKY